MDGIIDRMIRAAKLDPELYEEVEADGGATVQAGVVVAVSSLAGGIGAVSLVGVTGLFLLTAAALLSWVVWATVIYVVGAKILPEPQTEADVPQLLRTLGFAATPGVIRIFGVVPVLGALAAIVSMLWTLAAMVIAVRQALDYQSTGRAVAVCVIGLLLQIAVNLIVLRPFLADGV